MKKKKETKGKAGWFGQSKRHSEASVKGWNKRFKRSKGYSLADIKKIHAKRSLRARTLDSRKNTKLVSDNRFGQWVRNPNRFDIGGVDTNQMTFDEFKKISFVKHEIGTNRIKVIYPGSQMVSDVTNPRHAKKDIYDELIKRGILRV